MVMDQGIAFPNVKIRAVASSCPEVSVVVYKVAYGQLWWVGQ